MGGNPGVGSLHRFPDGHRDRLARPITVEKHSHAGMAARSTGAASGLPFAILRGHNGTDLPAHTDTIAPMTCPFTREQLAAVRALKLDVPIVRAQQVGPGRQVTDLYYDWAPVREVEEDDALLVRPDKHIGWRSVRLRANPERALQDAMAAILGRGVAA